MALINNKIQKSLHCDKKECKENLKHSIKVYDTLKSSTMDLVKVQKSKAELVFNAKEIVKTPIDFLPGGVKMAVSAILLGVVVWTSLQFGAEFGTSSNKVQAFSMFRLPVSLQSFVGWYHPLVQTQNSGPGLIHMMKNIDERLATSVAFATQTLERMRRMEENLRNSGINVQEGTPMHGQLIASYPTDDALSHGRDALVAVKASLHLSHSVCYEHGFRNDECARFLTMHKLPSSKDSVESSEESLSFLGDKCAEQHGASLICSKATKYRSANGSCNHLTHPSWGQSLTGYRRLLFAQYGDGIQEPRSFSTGMAKNKQNLLPSPRVVSSNLAINADLPDDMKTLAFMQWTQFVEHDLAHTPITKMYNNFESSIMCCDGSGQELAPRHIHPACMSIAIPRDDPVYGKKRITCMNYVRSVTALRPDCSFGPAEQMNQVTHYLDGSMIYGSTEEKAGILRLFSNGHLKNDAKDGRMFLPSAVEPSKQCQLSSDSRACYESGDVRVNAHPHLTLMHTIWLREHNRVADELASMNPHWNDEQLYQEARRIVIAEIQHITYKEWLPLILGEKYTKKFGLEIKSSGFSTEYSEHVDPSITNSFATAALRFVHSLMEGNLRLVKENREVNHTLRLHDHFNRPRVLEEPDHFDALLRGLATQNSQKNDMHFTEDITSFLYRDSGSYGLDIISLDIQRGRDHGLPGYNQFRKMCGLPAASDFSGFSKEISKTMIHKLKSMYRSPDDIDLLIGGMAEHPKEDSLLGPTFRCIIGEQLSRTRKGDRFFYDLKNQRSSFTSEQLQQIRKATLSRVLCDNSDDVATMQSNIFHKPSSSNKLVSCEDTKVIPKVNLRAWGENY